jgi:hypothetical protein
VAPGAAGDDARHHGSSEQPCRRVDVLAEQQRGDSYVDVLMVVLGMCV